MANDEGAKSPLEGGNIGPLKEKIKKALKETMSLRDDRDAVNVDLAAVKASLASAGCSKKAFSFGVNLLLMDTAERLDYLTMIDIVREVVENSKEEDLFNQKKD